MSALLALYGAGVLAASIDWMWEIPVAFGPVVVAAALLTGAATVTAEATPTADVEAAPRGPSRRMLAVATLLCAWVALWCSGDMLLTQVKLDQSQSETADASYADAADAADTAIALQPWAAQPRFQLALVQEASGDLRAARSTLDEAAERAPEDWQIWFLLSRVEAESGDPEAARAAFEQAQQLTPRSPTVLIEPDFLR